MTTLISRRQFTQLLGAGLFAASAPTVLARSVAAPEASAAAALYRNALVVDANALASIGQAYVGDDIALLNKAIAASGVTVVKATLGNADGDFEAAVADIAAAQGLIDAHPDRFLKILRAEDLDRARRERKLGIIFSFEAATPLEDKLDRIDLFRQMGVRIMQLSYNRTSPLAVGCLDGDEKGLTPLGRQAIERMNSLGVAVDLSHTNAASTAQGIAASTKPVLITHGGCRALHDHPRNKFDREMRAMAEKGGVMGIYMLPFLTEESRQPSLEDYIAHVAHALKVCGEDHVGIGSDVPFDALTEADIAGIRAAVAERKAKGISAPGEDRPPYIPELNSARKLETVTDALLRRGYSPRIAEKVLGTNFRDAFARIWTA
ncbi:dipeptidase [Tahibacter amnicola]|uniref:Dipeptidase n=1 Tax=Tahibacter amnicola TaxID=2976241 RepID=A0ABY6BAN7_9GAMM|nr:dipeptidase [Tahibacter amnicola]UXI66744.1 dipeptidase [Tahibacter amnicola]